MMHFASYYRWLVYALLFGQDGFGRARSTDARPGRPARLLDIGCKEGAFSRLLAPMAGQIVGVDVAVRPPAGLERGLRFVTGDGQALPFRPGAFDFVLMNDVLEHMPDDCAAARCACAALAPGGRLWLSTPAIQYSVGPAWVTARFERAWGHVRKGYMPDALARLFSPLHSLRIIVWPEPAFRAMQLPNWLISRLSMGLARRIAALCFWADRRAWTTGRGADSLSGHLYLSGRKPGADSE
jgi:SAM-dependent methyltransferase